MDDAEIFLSQTDEDSIKLVGKTMCNTDIEMGEDITIQDNQIIDENNKTIPYHDNEKEKEIQESTDKENPIDNHKV